MSDATKIKPTGYTLTLTPDTLYVFMRVFGHSCGSARKEYIRHSDEMDAKAAQVYSKFLSKLKQDRFMHGNTGEFIP